jgi:myo-inositol-1(or 4)-monophosphatase
LAAVSGAAALQADLEVALAAARAAAEVVASHFRTAIEVRYKDTEQPVTEADLAADDLLRDALLGARPEYGWLSEESAARPGRAGGRSWLVDPIDGTSSFVEGIPEFAVSVGLVEGDRPVVGVVANPATGQVYWAVEGGGAWLDGVRISVRDAPGAARVLVASRAEQRKGWLAAFGGWELASCGSTAVKMCRVAEGRADAFVSFGPKHPWDVCAADLIVREAGGTVTDLRGDPLPYHAAAAWTGLAVSRPGLHAELLRTAAVGALAPDGRGR